MTVSTICPLLGDGGQLVTKWARARGSGDTKGDLGLMGNAGLCPSGRASTICPLLG